MIDILGASISGLFFGINLVANSLTDGNVAKLSSDSSSEVFSSSKDASSSSSSSTLALISFGTTSGIFFFCCCLFLGGNLGGTNVSEDTNLALGGRAGGDTEDSLVVLVIILQEL